MSEIWESIGGLFALALGIAFIGVLIGISGLGSIPAILFWLLVKGNIIEWAFYLIFVMFVCLGVAWFLGILVKIIEALD